MRLTAVSNRLRSCIYKLLNAKLLLCLSIVLNLWAIKFYLDTSKLDLYTQPKSAPYVFVGGHPGTGTTLLCSLLDMHQDIRCGPESSILLRVCKNRLEHYRNVLAPDVANNASAAFISNIINRMGPLASIIAFKHPITSECHPYFAELFPKAKFIITVRDGRGAVESVTRRRFDPLFRKEDPLRGLHTWESRTREYIQNCQMLGPDRCLMLRYEELIMKPEAVLKRVLMDFLHTSWEPKLLHHEDFLNEISGLSRKEKKNELVRKPLHTDSIDRWYGEQSVLPDWFRKTAHTESELMEQLGYASIGIPPNYSKLALSIPPIKKSNIQ